MNNYYKYKSMFNTFLIIAFLTISGVGMYSYSTGYAGLTDSGCTCHSSANSNTQLTVTSSTGSFSMKTGEKVTFTVRVANSNRTYYGANIAVKTSSTGGSNAGTLTAVTGLKTSSNELVHNGPQTSSNNYFDFVFEWTAPSSAGTYYIKAVGNAVNNDGGTSNDQMNFMTAKAITVTEGPSVTLTAPTGGQNWCAGTSQDITWTSKNVTNVKIELSTDGGSSFPTVLAASVPASANTYSWSIPGSQASGSLYKVRIVDASDATVNSASGSNFSISSAAAITANPESITKCTGQTATFNITATGAGLNYQWKKDGNNVSNGTTATLNIAGLKTTDAGTYTCTVSNSCGTPVTSSGAVLTIKQAASIAVQPKSDTICSGINYQLTAEGAGDDITVKWQKDNEDIPNATTNTLTLTNVKASDAGLYKFVVTSGACGNSVTSNFAFITVTNSTTITTQPKLTEGCSGTGATISVEATGLGLSYKWYKDGIELPNQTNSSIEFSSLTIADEGLYKVEVSGECGSPVTSNEIPLNVETLPEMLVEASDQSVVEGSSVTFTFEPKDAGYTWQWRKDGVDIPGENKKMIVIPMAAKGDEGEYDCKVSNKCGNTTTKKVSLTVISAGSDPLISLSSTNVNFGSSPIGVAKGDKFTITNSGTDDLVINNIIVTPADATQGEFMVMQDLPLTIKNGTPVDILLEFNPKVSGVRMANITFTSNAANNGSALVNLMGNGLNGTGLSLTVDEVDFDESEVGQESSMDFALNNNSNSEITITSITLSDETHFSVLSPENGTKVAPGAQQLIAIGFNPQSSGTFTAELTITTSLEEFKLPVTGTGVISSIPWGIPSVSNLKISPNPSSTETVINFEMNEANNYTLEIYNLNGEVVKSFNSNTVNGNVQIKWDGRDSNSMALPSGSYNGILTIGGRSERIPIVISK